MKAVLFTVLLVITVISAWDHRLTKECVYGIQDSSTCCEDVPDAWFAHLKNPEDCNTYYQCVHGQPELMPCPEDLEWSVELDSCQFKEIAKCSTTNA